jgi:hypothetical protein
VNGLETYAEMMQKPTTENQAIKVYANVALG